MAELTLSAEPTHSRWNRALEPRLRVAPGNTVHLECLDSSGAQVHPAMNVAEFLKIDRGRIHALTQVIEGICDERPYRPDRPLFRRVERNRHGEPS